MNDKPGSPSDHHAESSTGGHTGSQATFWTLALLAAPVLYLLTLPPIFFGSYMLSGRRPPAPLYQWETLYVAPYDWAAQHTPLREPLFQYSEWWAWVTGFKNL